jgi:hypothetical protein
MTISFAITVCNEFVEIQRLIKFLLEKKRSQDTIVVLYDSKNGSPSVEEFLRAKSINGEFTWRKAEFKNNFSDWKNKLTRMCSGDFIFNIDADEIPHEDLIEDLPDILEANPQVEVYNIPRINTVEGLTQEHITKWGWYVNESGWVNFPDYQQRIYKNIPEIRWRNKVHEVLEGYKTIAQIPAFETLSLYHPKTIERQEKQNSLYDTLQSN